MPRPLPLGSRLAPLALFLAASCGSSADTPAATPPPTATTLPSAPVIPGAAGDILLDTDATLTDGRGSFTVPVREGERVRVTLTSSSFDPILIVQPPNAGRLSNDDFNGDRTRSELDLRMASSGSLKIEVGVWGAPGPGTYHVHAERVSTPPSLVAAAPAGAATHHTLWAATGRGYVAGAVPTAPTAPAAATVRLGDRVEASLGAGDATLPSGEFADNYTLEVSEAGHLAVQMRSGALDSFLVVTGPNGERLENDDSGGSLDSMVEIDATPGTWNIVATTYRAGMTGAYELKVLSPRDIVAALPVPAPGAPASAPATAGERVERGSLAAGDAQLSSGEFSDTYELSWPVGTAVHLEARSTAFDTYLILRTPSGRQTDNDDQVPGNLNAALDFVVSEAGPHRVLVTSYAPGMTGDYELAIRGGSGPTVTPPPAGSPPPAIPPTAPPPAAAAGAGRTERGELAAGDRTLSSGEFVDSFPMTFTAGSPVSIRVESTEFDTYLIVRSPSGRQSDNDDIQPGVLNSGVDLPSAEAGEYTVSVTSYRPGETGHYTLTTSAGSPGAPPAVAMPGVPGTPGTPPSAGPIPSGGTRVWTVSVGISDYPGSANDLPECANDAVKIAEALRNQGLTATDREFLLTDANATRANITQALSRVAAGIQPGDVFVFFYSGHGGQTRAARADDPNELDGLDEYIVAYDGNLGDDEFATMLSAIHARTTLVALDSCFSGGFAKDVVSRPNVVGMFSSEEDVTSGVAPEFRAGGYLSHFLRMGISGEGDNDPRDRALTVGELSHYVWQQYAEHGADLRMGEGYQHLVVDRGSVHNDTVLWSVGR